MSSALEDVAAERRRQIEAEGYTTAHDDEHAKGEIARAAACYARIASDWDNYAFPEGCPADWPWSPVYWKWTDPRRDLVKAGALILAEIERLDRAEAAGRAAVARTDEQAPSQLGSLSGRPVARSDFRYTD